MRCHRTTGQAPDEAQSRPNNTRSGKFRDSATHQFQGRQYRIEIVRAAERNLSIARFNGNDQFAGRDKVGYMPAKLATHISHALRPPPGDNSPQSLINEPD